VSNQTGEVICLQLRLGRINLLSIPVDFVPRRIDWAKWIECISIGAKVLGDRHGIAPKIAISPDHLESKDNASVVAIQGQRGLDEVDLIKLFSEVGEASRFIFVGSWQLPTTSWINSSQAVFSSKYSALIANVLTSQMKYWNPAAERQEKSGAFLVIDDVGRLSSLSSICKAWRARQLKTANLTEAKMPSWCAATVDIHLGMSSEGEGIRLHRIAVLEPDQWCDSPNIREDILKVIRAPEDCPEIWVSAPSLGLSLWIVDQQESLKTSLSKLRAPSAILGWHPVRDSISFLSDAPSKSMLYMVDRHSRLQVLMKEREAST
jgi:hypothetical protein